MKRRYIVFIEQLHRGNTSVWAVQNDRDHEELGLIKWYSPWRRYCYFPGERFERWHQPVRTVYSAECLRTIADFIDALMEARDQERRATC